jgi:hypothetical protein
MENGDVRNRESLFALVIIWGTLVSMDSTGLE